ncbi:hypothetical protein F4821DRAFT_192054 [Hypoxylon rubiginosum]|uniref:Uncharacterized protein n=1 Tax=Hypoxylon rubiginosum TaxID=110542 RepID=A0ACC0CSV1_9PEZI|nr:hypothetical protein F4821DRAFT_192054 [Hypoxylon rubiginosum]
MHSSSQQIEMAAECYLSYLINPKTLSPFIEPLHKSEPSTTSRPIFHLYSTFDEIAHAEKTLCLDLELRASSTCSCGHRRMNIHTESCENCGTPRCAYCMVVKVPATS